MLNDFTKMAREVLPEVVRSVSDAVLTLQALNDTVKQFDYQPLLTGLNETGQRATTFSEQIAGFLANLSAWGDAIFGWLGDKLSLTGQQIEAFYELLKGESTWGEYQARMAELAETNDTVNASFMGVMENINANVGQFDEMVAGIVKVNEANAEATDWWQRHGTAAAEAATVITEATEPALTSAAAQLSALAEATLPDSTDSLFWMLWLLLKKR